jgi:hypothetical protein
MIERGTKLYVMLDDKQLVEDPEDGVIWTDSFTTSIPIAPNEELYLLTVSYTTGNSLGRDPEIRYECIDVYTSQALAVEQAKTIREHYDRTKNVLSKKAMSYEESTQVAVKLGSGEDYVCHAPWIGYFEHIEEIEVSRVHFGPAAVLKF